MQSCTVVAKTWVFVPTCQLLPLLRLHAAAACRAVLQDRMHSRTRDGAVAAPAGVRVLRHTGTGTQKEAHMVTHTLPHIEVYTWGTELENLFGRNP